MRPRLLLALVLTIAIACIGCDAPSDATKSPAAVIALATQPPMPGGPVACMAALLEGPLVRDPRTGLGIGIDDGQSVPVRWPNGWQALDTVPIVLVNANGDVVAQVGDRLALGGGLGPPGETWIVCPTDIKVVR